MLRREEKDLDLWTYTYLMKKDFSGYKSVVTTFVRFKP